MPSVNKSIAIILAILIAGTSAFIIAPRMTDPANRESTIEYLDEQQANVAKITASTTALSVVLAALPTDAADPAANKLMDLSGYLVVVLCAVFLEKYLLIALSGLGFKIIIPFACLLFIIAVVLSRGKLRELAVKLAIMGLLVVTIVPASVAVGRSVDTTYESLTSTVSIEETDNDKKSSSVSINSKLEEAKQYIRKYMEKIAIMIVTSCIIPVLVLLVMMWAIKLLFGLDLFAQADKFKTGGLLERARAKTDN